MTNQELQDLKERLRYVVANGFEMACIEKYAEDLAELGADMPEGDVTPAALLAMAGSVAEAKPKSKKESPASPAPKKSSATVAKAKKDEEAAKAKEEESKPPVEGPKPEAAAQEMKAGTEAVKEEPEK